VHRAGGKGNIRGCPQFLQLVLLPASGQSGEILSDEPPDAFDTGSSGLLRYHLSTLRKKGTFRGEGCGADLDEASARQA